MKRLEFYEALETRFPLAWREEGDNDGAMCLPDRDREVARVLCALDCTAEVVEAAVSGGFDLILTHHPLVYRPLKNLSGNGVADSRLLRLIRENIAVFSFHTRADKAEGGVNTCLAARLGLQDAVPLREDGMGRVGTLASPMPLEEFCDFVKKSLQAPRLFYAGDRPVHRVAVLGGSGGEFVSAAQAAGADTYVTGELSYHMLTDAKEMGINLVVAGHYETEVHVLPAFAALVRTLCPHATVEIYAERHHGCK